MQSVLSQRPRGHDDRYVHMTFPGRRADPSSRRARLVPRIKGTHESVHPRLGHRGFHLGRIRPPSADKIVSLVLSSYINPLTSVTCSWLQQLGIYLAALLLMKLFVLALFAVALDDVLLPLAGWILNWMQEWSQVVFVMAVFPLFMNIIQVRSPRSLDRYD